LGRTFAFGRAFAFDRSFEREAAFARALAGERFFNFFLPLDLAFLTERFPAMNGSYLGDDQTRNPWRHDNCCRLAIQGRGLWGKTGASW
jgi:hypothetical protein